MGCIVGPCVFKFRLGCQGTIYRESGMFLVNHLLNDVLLRFILPQVKERLLQILHFGSVNADHLDKTRVGGPFVTANVIGECNLFENLGLVLLAQSYVLELRYHLALQHHVEHGQSLNS